MLTRITALLAIVILLLPSSLTAMVSCQLQSCLDSGNMPDCCCSHEEESSEPQDPSFSRGCCCELEVPQPLPSGPEPARLAEIGVQLDWLLASLQEQLLPKYADVQLNSEPRIQGPPRAPPRPLFLRFQSFLI